MDGTRGGEEEDFVACDDGAGRAVVAEWKGRGGTDSDEEVRQRWLMQQKLLLSQALQERESES